MRKFFLAACITIVAAGIWFVGGIARAENIPPPPHAAHTHADTRGFGSAVVMAENDDSGAYGEGVFGWWSSGSEGKGGYERGGEGGSGSGPEPSHGCSDYCDGGKFPPPPIVIPPHRCTVHCGGGVPVPPPVIIPVPVPGSGCVTHCCTLPCHSCVPQCGGNPGGPGGGGIPGGGGGGSTSTTPTSTVPGGGGTIPGGGGGTSTTPTSTTTSTEPGGGGIVIVPGGGGGAGGTPTAEIAIAKSEDSANPPVGAIIHYTVVVSALGPSASIGVIATDTLPAGLTFVSATTSQGTYVSATGAWEIGELTSGQKVTLTITATVNAGTLGMTIANTAVVGESPNVGDQNLGNNSSTVTLVVQGGSGGGTVPAGGSSGGGVPAGGNTVTSGGGGGGTVTSGGGGGGGGGGSPSGGQVLGASLTCGIYLNEYIHPIRKDLNDSSEVMKLQRFLNMNLGTNLPITGYYGPLTIQAVDQFQTKYHREVLAPWVPYGLQNEYTPTDYVYKTTQRWINMIMCPALNLSVPSLP